MNRPLYKKVDDLVWIVNYRFYEEQTIKADVSRPYAVYCKKIYDEDIEHSIWRIFIEFKDEADECEFIIKESI